MCEKMGQARSLSSFFQEFIDIDGEPSMKKPSMLTVRAANCTGLDWIGGLGPAPDSCNERPVSWTGGRQSGPTTTNRNCLAIADKRRFANFFEKPGINDCGGASQLLT